MIINSSLNDILDSIGRSSILSPLNEGVCDDR